MKKVVEVLFRVVAGIILMQPDLMRGVWMVAALFLLEMAHNMDRHPSDN